MNKPAHTPGPWAFHSNGRNYFVDGPDLHGAKSPIADICDRGEQDEQPLANAKLIAAAPELLEMLTELVTRFDLIRLRGYVGSNLFDKAHAVIKKARS